ncbi:12544_t:CDS:2 [Acaulospora colombiana]|uniref:12544_t:CDS:1 n=1 Tax=Acaulospora colombiana TaxID=27376 RepID=A0ACA9MET3_9GLOM|nr:12544_t:CDS:2 [Acaulospora colombiana]
MVGQRRCDSIEETGSRKRTLERQLDLHAPSVRKPDHTEEEAGAALVVLVNGDPYKRAGARTLQEKLASGDVHVSRKFVNEFLTILDYDGVQSRRPGARKVHRHALHSIGPDEECPQQPPCGHGAWLLLIGRPEDGRYVAQSPIRMSITRSRCPNPSDGRQSSSFAPNMDLQEVPAFVHMKSTHNITIERQWRALYSTHLENLIFFWHGHGGVYHAADEMHQ